MTETEILSILTDWNFWGSFDERPKDRSEYLTRIQKLFSNKTATVLLGVRRAGKSTLIHLYIKQSIAANRFDARETLVINFEDPRFYLPLSSADLMDIYELYLKQLDPSQPLIVLDEVQNVEGWEKFVRYLLETKKTNVVITGSSSKLLGEEISTVLTGRHVNIEVFPLSFREFLQFKGLSLANDVDIAKHKIKIQRLFDEYVQWGGFPEIVLSESILRKRELLNRYFEDIVIKDIVKRFGVKEIEKLERLTNVLISNIATLQSFNRLKERIGTSLDTVERFAKYLELARMFFYVKKFDFSIGKQIRSVNKTYVVDTGLYTAKGFKFSENFGRIAENIVAVELFRKRSFDSQLEIYYWKDYRQKEVDFVIKKGSRIKQLVQVCWESSEADTQKREINSLLKAGQELNCEDLLIVTNDYEAKENFVKNGVEAVVRFLPLWRWLLK